jgi:hypothetical protein
MAIALRKDRSKHIVLFEMGRLILGNVENCCAHLLRSCLATAIVASCICAYSDLCRAGTPLQIASDSLMTATQGTAYGQQITTTGGDCASDGTASSTVNEGALPTGISIVTPVSTDKQWFVQGTPATAGTFHFSVRLRWTHKAVSPFDRTCTDEAVGAFALIVLAAPVSLNVSTKQIIRGYRTGHLMTRIETVGVTSGDAHVAFTAQSVTDSGGPWLTVFPQHAITPAVLNITYAVTSLSAGTYNGRVIVGDGGVTVGITLIVATDSNGTLQTSASALSFSAVAGWPDPPAQLLAVTIGGDSVMFQAGASSSGKWLSVSPQLSATPKDIKVVVLSKDLSPGTYSGVVTLTAVGVTNSSRTVPVTLTVQPAVRQPGLR